MFIGVCVCIYRPGVGGKLASFLLSLCKYRTVHFSSLIELGFHKEAHLDRVKNKQKQAAFQCEI